MFDNAPLNLNLHNYCLAQAVEFFYCVGTMRKAKQRTIVQVKWFKPPVGWFKINSDGASYGNPGKARGGSIAMGCGLKCTRDLLDTLPALLLSFGH